MKRRLFRSQDNTSDEITSLSVNPPPPPPFHNFHGKSFSNVQEYGAKGNSTKTVPYLQRPLGSKPGSRLMNSYDNGSDEITSFSVNPPPLPPPFHNFHGKSFSNVQEYGAKGILAKSDLQGPASSRSLFSSLKPENPFLQVRRSAVSNPLSATPPMRPPPAPPLDVSRRAPANSLLKHNSAFIPKSKVNNSPTTRSVAISNRPANLTVDKQPAQTLHNMTPLPSCNSMADRSNLSTEAYTTSRSTTQLTETRFTSPLEAHRSSGDLLQPISPVSPIDVSQNTGRIPHEIKIPPMRHASLPRVYCHALPASPILSEVPVSQPEKHSIGSKIISSFPLILGRTSSHSSASSNYSSTSLVGSSNTSNSLTLPTVHTHNPEDFDIFRKLQEYSFEMVNRSDDTLQGYSNQRKSPPVQDYSFSQQGCDATKSMCTWPSPSHIHQSEPNNNETPSFPKAKDTRVPAMLNMSDLELDRRVDSAPKTPKTPTLPARSKMRESAMHFKASLAKLQRQGTFKELPELPPVSPESEQSPQPALGLPRSLSKNTNSANSHQEWKSITANLNIISKSIDKWEKIEGDIQTLLDLTEDSNGNKRGADGNKSAENVYQAKMDYPTDTKTKPLQFRSYSPAGSVESLKDVEQFTPSFQQPKEEMSSSSVSSANRNSSSKTSTRNPSCTGIAESTKLGTSDEKRLFTSPATEYLAERSNSPAFNDYKRNSENSQLLEEGLDADYLRHASTQTSLKDTPSTSSNSRAAYAKFLFQSPAGTSSSSLHRNLGAQRRFSHRPRFFSTSALIHESARPDFQSQFEPSTAEDLSREEIRKIAAAAVAQTSFGGGNSSGSQPTSVTSFYTFQNNSNLHLNAQEEVQDVRQNLRNKESHIASDHYAALDQYQGTLGHGTALTPASASGCNVKTCWRDKLRKNSINLLRHF